MNTIKASEGVTILFGDPEKNIESSIAQIKESVAYLIQRNQELSTELNQYDEKAVIKAKDDEIQSIQQRSISVLSPVEYERDKEFRERHYQICKNGSHFIYDLQGTGIGTVVKVRCPVCGVEEDITDTSCW